MQKEGGTRVPWWKWMADPRWWCGGGTSGSTLSRRGNSGRFRRKKSASKCSINRFNIVHKGLKTLTLLRWIRPCEFPWDREIPVSLPKGNILHILPGRTLTRRYPQRTSYKHTIPTDPHNLGYTIICYFGLFPTTLHPAPGPLWNLSPNIKLPHSGLLYYAYHVCSHTLTLSTILYYYCYHCSHTPTRSTILYYDCSFFSIFLISHQY